MEADLKICNLVSRGYTLNQAREKLGLINGTEAAPVVAPEKEEEEAPKKLSAKEKKEALGAEIQNLGGEVPEMSASVAKFEEALTAAKVAFVKRQQDEADAAQEIADRERAEAEAAAAELM